MIGKCCEGGIPLVLLSLPFSSPPPSFSSSHHHILPLPPLKNRVEERLEVYSQRFDVVLLGDGDLSYVIALLNELVGEKDGGSGGSGGMGGKSE